MFAVALDIPLESLLWPIHESDAVSVAPGIEVSPWRALEWSIGNDALPEIGTDVESWNRAFSSIGAIVDLLNVADLAERHRVQSPKEEYRKRLQELARYLHQANEIGLAIEGIIPEAVLKDLQEAEAIAPMKQRTKREHKEEES